MISPQVSDVDTHPAPTTCEMEFYDPLCEWRPYQCENDAEFRVGTIRTCGCPPTTAAVYCWDCTQSNGDCLYCGAFDVCVVVEPVRLSAVHQ